MSLEIVKHRPLDSGSGTTVNLVELPFGIKFVRKDFNLAGSETINHQTLRNYQHLTQKVSTFLSGSNLENWRVNPILFIGQGKYPFTISPFVEGASLDQLITSSNGEYFRSELNKVNRLLRFVYPHERIKVIALNATLTPKNLFVITNLREYVDPTHSPIQLFRRHQALSS